MISSQLAHQLSLQHLAAVLTPNLTELLSSDFSVHNHGFCRVRTHFPRKKKSMVISIKLQSIYSPHVVKRTEISTKINASFVVVISVAQWTLRIPEKRVAWVPFSEGKINFVFILNSFHDQKVWNKEKTM